MMSIPCPWCGPREETEFRYGGEAHVSMPDAGASAHAWSRYLYFRSNPVGPFTERWVHVHGCRRWFNLVRDTTSHEISGAYLPGQRPEDGR